MNHLIVCFCLKTRIKEAELLMECVKDFIQQKLNDHGGKLHHLYYKISMITEEDIMMNRIILNELAIQIKDFEKSDPTDTDIQMYVLQVAIFIRSFK